MQIAMYPCTLSEPSSDAVVPYLSGPVASTSQPSHSLTHLRPILAPTPLRLVSNFELRKKSQQMPCPLLRQGLRHTAPTRAATGTHAELVGIDTKFAQRVRGDIALWRVVFAHPRWNEGKRESEVSEARAVRGEVGEELAGRELADGVGRDGGVIVAAVEGLELRPGAGEPGEGCIREFVIRRDVE